MKEAIKYKALTMINICERVREPHKELQEGLSMK